MTLRSITIGGVMVLLLLAAGSIFLWYPSHLTPEQIPGNVLINGVTYQLEVVDTDAARSLGLGGRDALCEHCGMLFVFPAARRYGFWMKDMRFPIDIVWLRDDEVVHIVRRVPETSTEVFLPEKTANRVLEFNAGVLDPVQIGERMIFLPK